jgi:beta-galactosidase GanA
VVSSLVARRSAVDPDLRARAAREEIIRGRWRISIAALAFALTLTLAAGMRAAPVRAAAKSTVAGRTAHTITWDHYSLMIDGKRVFIYSGSLHPFRLPSPSLWLDVLEKMKAAGFNTVTSYFDWGYVSPAPGVYDFSGVRNIDRYLADAAKVGLYVIARPGPYINAEHDGGGFPGWLARMAGTPRTTDPTYLRYALQWLHEVDPIIARHQLTNGTGTVIATQVENEIYDSDTTDGQNYMAALEHQMRTDGITVPLSGNDNSSFVTGPGAVQLPGFDSYPLGFDCSSPTTWPDQVPDEQGYHLSNPNSPLYFPEFQGGSFDPWGGAGYDKCRELTGSQFEKVYYDNNIAAGSTMMNFYMTFGGTSWGFMPCTCVYSSYDYGSAITEARQLTDKYNQQKLIANFLQAATPLTKTDELPVAPPSNPNLTVLGRANPDNRFELLTLRHADTTSTTTETTHLALDLAGRTTVSDDDSSPAIVYSPGWTHASNQDYTAGDYGNTESFANTAGASAAFTFHTSAVRYVGVKGSNGGIADVYLDGNKVATADTYAPGNKEYEQVLYRAAGLAPGTHTLKVVVTGQHDAASSDAFVSVDGFDAFNEPANDYYPRVPQQPGTAITVPGRDSQLLVTHLAFGDQRLVYTTSQLVTDGTSNPNGAGRGTDIAVLYGAAGSDGETVLRYTARPRVKILRGTVTSTWDRARGDLRLDYKHVGLSEVRISGRGRRPVKLLLTDTAIAKRLWPDQTSRGLVLTRGPYLVRSARLRGSTLALRGDTAGPTSAQAFVPAGITTVTWNGLPVAARRQADGSLRFSLGGPHSVRLPALTHWKFAFESPERQPGFDDSSWTRADHTTTNNPNPPGSLPVLYEDDYGFHNGDVWYRGHFTATGNETGITIDGEGGSPAGMWSAWINGALLGTEASGTHTFTFPPGVLRKGADNVIAVLVYDSGHDECGAPCGSFQDPRGIRTAVLTGASTPITWRIQGNRGGEYPLDTARGPLNVGGLYGERQGWYLPGYPDAGWRPVSLPNRWSAEGLPPGIGWYRTTFSLHIPPGDDMPVGLQISDAPTYRDRAEIFVNGWLLGLYANDLGPQHVFSLPTGLLNPDGQNTVAVAVWGEDEAAGGLGNVSLVPYGTYRGGVSVSQVTAPGWNRATYGSPRPPQDASLDLASPTTILQGSQTVKITGTLTNPAGSAVTEARVRIAAPSGWTVTPSGPISVPTLPPGHRAIISWTVQAPANLTAGTYQVGASATYTQRHSSGYTAGAATFTVPYAALGDAFSNIGISDDANPAAANFDGAGYSFSEQALTADGLAPGATAPQGGVSFPWPNVPAGQPDNVVADGQVIDVSGQGGTLGFLGAGNSGSPAGNGTVYYSDGSTQTFRLQFDDFWYSPGPENTTVAAMPYVNSPTGKYGHTVSVFFAHVPIDSTKHVIAVGLPAISASSAGHSTAMHIFAIGLD